MSQFLAWWQHLPEHIDPVLLQIGALQVRYYGLMYLLSFLVVYVLLLSRLKKEDYSYPKEMIGDYLFWTIIGVIIGSRLGYVMFYNFEYFLRHPWQIFLPLSFEDGIQYTGISGLSYHGGLVGVVVVTLVFCYKRKLKLWEFADFLVPTVPLGYTLGRIGNFLNGELYGRVTDVPWGMYFPQAPTYQLRHPSQLYEAFFEGIILFVVLWSLRKAKVFDGFSLVIYLVGYGLVRFLIEFYRQPDAHIGLVAFSLSMGQILCFAMILAGGAILLTRIRGQATFLKK